MKVHQILAEADTPKLVQRSGKWTVEWPDGTTQIFNNQQQATSAMRDWSNTNRLRATRDVPPGNPDVELRLDPDEVRHAPGTRVEPTLSDPNAPKAPELPGETRPNAIEDIAKNDSKWREFLTKAKKLPVFGKIIKLFLGLTNVLRSTWVGSTISIAINASALEEELDIYLREIVQDPDGVSGERSERARWNLVHRLDDLVWEAAIAALGAAAGTGVASTAGFTFGISILVGLLIGGLAAYGASWVKDKADEYGLTDETHMIISRFVFNQQTTTAIAEWVDAVQAYANTGVDLTVGTAVRAVGAADSDTELKPFGESAETGSAKVDVDAIARKIQADAAEDPKIKYALGKGLRELKKAKEAEEE